MTEFSDYVEIVNQCYGEENYQRIRELYPQLETQLNSIKWSNNCDDILRLLGCYLIVFTVEENATTNETNGLEDNKCVQQIFYYFHDLLTSGLRSIVMLDIINSFTHRAPLEDKLLWCENMGDEFRCKWLAGLYVILDRGDTNKQIDEKQFFEEATKALLVYLKLETSESVAQNLSLHLPETRGFLNKCIDMVSNRTYKLNFGLLFNLIVSLEIADQMGRHFEELYESFSNFRETAHVLHDTFVTATQCLKITQKVFVQRVDNSNVATIWRFLLFLIDLLRTMKYVKFCDDCHSRGVEEGELHELKNVISITWLVFKEATEKNFMNASMQSDMAEIFNLKMSLLRKLNCRQLDQETAIENALKKLSEKTKNYQAIFQFFFKLIYPERPSEGENNKFNYLRAAFRASWNNQQWTHALSFGFIILLFYRNILTPKQSTEIARRIHQALRASDLCVTPIDSIVGGDRYGLSLFGHQIRSKIDEIAVLKIFAHIMNGCVHDVNVDLNDRIIAQIFQRTNATVSQSLQCLFIITEFTYSKFKNDINLRFLEIENQGHVTNSMKLLQTGLKIQDFINYPTKVDSTSPQKQDGIKVECSKKAMLKELVTKFWQCFENADEYVGFFNRYMRKLAEFAKICYYKDSALNIYPTIFNHMKDDDNFLMIEVVSFLMANCQRYKAEIENSIQPLLTRCEVIVKTAAFKIDELSHKKQNVLYDFICNSILYFNHCRNDAKLNGFEALAYRHLSKWSPLVKFKFYSVLILCRRKKCLDETLDLFEMHAGAEKMEQQELLTIFCDIVNAVNPYAQQKHHRFIAVLKKASGFCERFKLYLQKANIAIFLSTVDLMDLEGRSMMCKKFEDDIKEQFNLLNVNATHILSRKRLTLHTMVTKILDANGRCKIKTCVLCTNHSYQLLIYRLIILCFEFFHFTEFSHRDFNIKQKLEQFRDICDLDHGNVYKNEHVEFLMERVNLILSYFSDSYRQARKNRRESKFKIYCEDVSNIAKKYKTIINID